MKSISYLTALFLLGLCVNANAAITPGTWTSHTASTAVGSVGGITINATTTTSGSTAFHSIHPNRFGNGWDTANALGNAALALTTTSVDAGDSQTFTFSSPLLDGTLMYIENFDTSSVATVTANGGVSILSTSNVSYAGGVLTSSNPTSDGNGDVILVLDGGVTSISLDYTQGGGGNGVFYTFAEPCAHAVPEPTSAVVMAGLFGLGGMFYVRRRKQQA